MDVEKPTSRSEREWGITVEGEAVATERGGVRTMYPGCHRGHGR